MILKKSERYSMSEIFDRKMCFINFYFTLKFFISSMCTSGFFWIIFLLFRQLLMKRGISRAIYNNSTQLYDVKTYLQNIERKKIFWLPLPHSHINHSFHIHSSWTLMIIYNEDSIIILFLLISFSKEFMSLNEIN